MARERRLKVKGEAAYYHIISRTVGGEFYLGDVEKEKLVSIINRFSKLFLVDVIGYCVMSSHFHLLVKVNPGEKLSDKELLKRVKADGGVMQGLLHDPDLLRDRLSDISEYVRYIKQVFSRWYNRIHNRSGYFWGDRFKSVWIESGEALLACLAYIDLNPVRAEMVEKPEDYRFSSIGYRIQTGNRHRVLSWEGLPFTNKRKTLGLYRAYLYQNGGLSVEGKEGRIAPEIMKEAEEAGFSLDAGDVLRYRVRHFSDGLVIGSRGFIREAYSAFGGTVIQKRSRGAYAVGTGPGIYSLRRLTG